MNGPKVDHSTAGAIELYNLKMTAAAACVAGHHAGIPDFGHIGDPADCATLFGRLKRQLPDYHNYINEITLNSCELPLYARTDIFTGSLFTRMLFSCLVDADYLDTENFMSNGGVARGGYDTLNVLLDRLMGSIEPWWKTDNAINMKRCEILRRCIYTASMSQGIFSLTVPTGGGKTIASLAFALHHAIHHQLKHVIYVIPYTSIIEQTAETFRKRLGSENVIEHHSSVRFDISDDDDGHPDSKGQHLATENWDAPIIVTTNVQFFESLYGNRPSCCRKLHNIAGSVVIFDEAQMLPLPYLHPCIKLISSLASHFKVTALMCTATQPAFDALLPDYSNVVEIVPQTDSLYEFFRRITVKHIGSLSNKELAKEIENNEQVLSIVSTRKQAKEVFMLIRETAVHLSTMMYPVHRSDTLGEIRKALAHGKPCRVVSTSLIEAGVDLDFPIVYKAESGIDSIVQAAGRCNREGKRPVESSMVYVFESENKPPLIQQQAIVLLHEILTEHPDFFSPEAIHAYFRKMYDLKGSDLDVKEIIQAIEKGRDGSLMPFKQIAEIFKLIETNTKNILIPIEDEAKKVADQIKFGVMDRSIMRKAGKYMVSVYENEYAELAQSGALMCINEDLAVLTDVCRYDRTTGLDVHQERGKALFC